MDHPTSTARILIAALSLACCLGPAYAASDAFVVPAWVYPGNPGAGPGEQAPVLPPLLFQAPDWHPDSHPPMPPIVQALMLE